jgi:catecholate siderophore receptor
MLRRTIIVLSVIIFGSSAFGGEGAGVRFSGKVVDQNQSPIAGAHITAALTGTGIRNETDTDASGEFTLDLAKGEYTLTITAKGFETLAKRVDVSSGSMRQEPFALSIAAARAEVTVSSEAISALGETSSATRTFTPLRDVPQAVTILRKDQIREQAMTSIADLVRYVPGVTAHQGENNRDDVIIRGNRSSADFFRDGVRDDVQYYRDVYNLERFEALKGPNAMIFGRGGGGGVINRVTKEAGFSKLREFTATGGSFYDRRFTGDVGRALNDRIAFRLNGVYEKSKSFRRFVGLERVGLNPTFAFSPDSKTSIHVGYEFFRDRRTADRGMTSFQNRPVNLPISTYYGNPDDSHVRANVNILSGSVERLFGDVIFRSRASFGDYDRGYQNYVPGAVNAPGTLVTLTAYNNATKRRNSFDQTDITWSTKTGSVKHTLVAGTEFGRQLTDNFRNTGYFNNTAMSITVPFANPTTNVPVTFRQSASDADNHLSLNLGAGFVQDQIEFSRYFQAIVGVRYDHFGLTYHNDRNGDTLTRVDRLVSPRIGLVIKPVEAVSFYGSYSISYLPSSGDQFASLTVITQQVKPEKFENYEVGVKWDVRPRLALTSAVYRLDRTNTRSTDPNNPAAIVQTGSQRADGFEFGLTGSLTPNWSVTGGYSYQDARITSATAAAPAGRHVAQVPHNTFSLWNRYQFTSRLGAGLGLIARSAMFAAIDNTVVLPGYLKADGAVFYTFNERWRLQANLENLTNRRYFVNADNNTNISPGAPRSMKVGLVARF